MRFAPINFCLLLLAVLLFAACGPKVVREQPLIYDAWDARYHYDPVTRKMIPVYGQESIGRAWGRDEAGRLDYIEFISGAAGKSENLLVHHQQKLDRKREINWEMENQARIDRIKASLEFMDENKSSETPVEPPPQDFGNDFVPASFLPVQAGETGTDESDAFSPFVPMEEDSATPESSTEPSPFEPLSPF